jgi:hypothetical protein
MVEATILILSVGLLLRVALNCRSGGVEGANAGERSAPREPQAGKADPPRLPGADRLRERADEAEATYLLECD